MTDDVLPAVRIGRVTSHRPLEFNGGFYLGGDAPTSPAPDVPDGRAKILNQPTAVQVQVYEQFAMRRVAVTISAPDGTWRVEGLSDRYNYTVIGFDPLGRANSAIQSWVRPAPMP